MHNGGNLNFIDIVNLVDFCLQLSALGTADNIHQHLQIQDDKIDRILTILEGMKDDNSGNI